MRMRTASLQAWILPALLAAGPQAQGTGEGAAPPQPGAVAPAGPRGEVVLPSLKVLQVEIADTDLERMFGYMYRERIGDDEGMIFLLDTLDFHPFWMKNCRLSLDIAWLDETWRVVHLERDLPPCKADPCTSYRPMQAARYVLEVRGGMAARLGLKMGDYIIYRPPPAAGD